MGYISTERVAEIRNELKATFPNFKFRCYREHHSTINVVIVSAPIQFISPENVQNSLNKGYVQANHYGGFKSQFAHSPEAIEALEKIQAIITKGQKHYETGDYGMQPNFYEHIYIGEYNKPFVVSATPAPDETAPVLIDGTYIKHNAGKDGIEIYFSGKPSDAVREGLKAKGFRWGKFNKCWYARINPRTIAAAAIYGTLPASLQDNGSSDSNNDAALVNAQEEAYSDNLWDSIK